MVDTSALVAPRSMAADRREDRDRARPSLFQYDYLVLDALGADIAHLLDAIPAVATAPRALDLGSASSPYRRLLAARGYSARTLDVGPGADFIGTAEDTGLPEASFDLVICTQVLEHCADPWKAMREMHRILRPGGHVVVSAPHVWFFHPHPTDHWRFTQQGLAHLVASAGFVVRQLRSQGGTVLAAAQVANFLAYGVLRRAGAPLYAIVNLLAKPVDRLAQNQLFCVNFAALARKD
ncbi:MAG TPA: methyltransferase domain-containing protein [Myxococcales bacterium]|nr:methyltransferase domain-containing protein [Myxococcales bacterium]